MKTLILTVAMLAALVVSPLAQAGRYNGPGSARARVQAGGTYIYTEFINANEVATVKVWGDGDTDLDLFIYDERGNLITRDIDPDGNPAVAFRPYVTSKFTIKVVNRGRVYNDFAIETN